MKKTAVPTHETEIRRFVGPTTRMRARSGDGWQRVKSRKAKKAPTSAARKDADIETMKKFNAGTNKSAAAGSTSLNLHEHTENLPLNAGTNKSPAAGSTSLNLHEHTENLPLNAGTNKSAETKNLRYVRRVSRERQERSPTPDSSEEDDLSTLPPRPAYAGDDWECATVGMKLKDGKEVRRNKDGCIINDDDDYEFQYAWQKIEVYSHDRDQNFHKKIEANISKATKRRKCSRHVIKAFPGVPPGYCPIEGVKYHLPGIVRRCASLALADFNGQEHTDYQLVNIEAAGCQPVNGVKYCVIFQARANGQDHTFKAWVVNRRVWGLERSNVYAIHVHAVMMMKPKSIERSGTLQELI